MQGGLVASATLVPGRQQARSVRHDVWRVSARQAAHGCSSKPHGEGQFPGQVAAGRQRVKGDDLCQQPQQTEACMHGTECEQQPQLQSLQELQRMVHNLDTPPGGCSGRMRELCPVQRSAGVRAKIPSARMLGSLSCPRDRRAHGVVASIRSVCGIGICSASVCLTTVYCTGGQTIGRGGPCVHRQLWSHGWQALRYHQRD